MRTLEVTKVTLRKKKYEIIGVNFCDEEPGIPSGLIYSIDQGSLASITNLHEGQQIISVNGQPVDTNDGIVQMIRGHAGILTLEVVNPDEVSFFNSYFFQFF